MQNKKRSTIKNFLQKERGAKHRFNILLVFTFLFLILSITTVSAVARLPTVGGDTDDWGNVLNYYLSKLAGSNATELNETMVNGTNIYSSAINTTHIIDGTITDADISDTTNLTLGEKITFTLGEIIDNIVDGWITITGGLNVTGNIETSNNVTANYFIGDGSQLTNIGSSSDTIWNITGSNYLVNNSGILEVNETKLNQTINALENDTLAGLSCADTEIAKWNNTASAWECQSDDGQTNTAGGGITITGSEVNATLGTSISNSEIDTDAINTTQIIDSTIVDADISDTTNLTLGEKITFTLGEVIDNIVNGWITITGGLNVTGNATISGTSLKVNNQEVCLADGTNCQSSTNVAWNITGSNYMINNSGILEVNETTLNSTIDTRASVFNETNLINSVNTSANIDSLGFLNKSGTNADQNLNISPYNITASYFKGDGSKLTGIQTDSLWTNSSGNATYIAGRVGIGTTTPSGKFHAVLDTDNYIAYFHNSKNSGGQIDGVFILDDRGYNGNQNGTALRVRSRNDGTTNTGALVNFETQSGSVPVSRFYIHGEDGDIGIGTTSPTHTLNVVGTANITDDVYMAGNMFINESSVGIGTVSPTGQLQLGDVFGAGGKNLVIGDDTFLSDIDTSNTLGIYGVSDPTKGGIRLGNNSGSLIFGDNGNIGIGTASPKTKLYVIMDSAYQSLEDTYGIRIDDSANLNTALMLAVNASDSVGIIQTMDPGNSWTSENLVLQPKGGNVGIGTTAPVIDLAIGDTDTGFHVPSNGELRIYTNNGIRMSFDGDGDVGVGETTLTRRFNIEDLGDDYPLRIEDSSHACGFGAGGSGITWVCASDERLKTNIRDAESVLDLIMSTRVRTFEWLSDGSTDTGFIAQEFIKVAPDRVSIGHDGYYQLSGFTNGEIIRVIQDQQEQIQELREENGLIKEDLCSLGIERWC